jgi:hypothetical protein
MDFVFLVYVSRSGSTFLARNLAEISPDLVVLPEIDLLNLLAAWGEDHVRNLNGRGLFRLMTLDERLMDIGLSYDDLRALAFRCAGKGIRQLMEDLVNEYATRVQGKEPKIALIKRGPLIWHYETLRHVFPEAVYLHIFRDPRGVVNSIIHTHRAYAPGEKMGRGDVYFAARQWVKFMERINALKHPRRAPILEIRYEDLCVSLSGTVKAILQHIGAAGTNGPGNGREYVFNVPARETRIHKLIQGTPAAGRIDAWKKELSGYQGAVIELIARQRMAEKDYRPHFLTGVDRAKLPVYFVLARIAHVHYTILFYSRRLIEYLFRPSRLGMRLRLALRSLLTLHG